MADGVLYIISAPSGAGKTSLVIALIDAMPGVQTSISHTTRQPRPGEQDGVHYHFIDRTLFEQLQAKQFFLEHAKVFDHDYGTSVEWVQTQLAAGTDVILEIDWQGARQARQYLPEAVSVFILPPSRDALEARLQRRGQDNKAAIARRMQDAINEMRHYEEFDYLVVNDIFEDALTALQTIVQSHRLKLSPQRKKLTPLLSELLKD